MCDHEVPADDRLLFCPVCHKVRSLDDLKSVRLPGFVGVANSTSEAIQEFWATGDPDIPGL